MLMTENEIYASWKSAKDQAHQIIVLAELNDTNKLQIKKIIDRQQFLEVESKKIKPVEKKKPEGIYTQKSNFDEVFKRLDELEAFIVKYTKEYKALSRMLIEGRVR